MDFQTTKESLRLSSVVQKKLTPLADTQKKQEQKAKEAAEYRARILKQQAQRDESGEMSPSLGREKAAIQASKLGRVGREDRLKSMEGKATSAQCAFNLANILMVRIEPKNIVIRNCFKLTEISIFRESVFWACHILVPRQVCWEALLHSLC